jgi:acyl carrier protein
MSTKENDDLLAPKPLMTDLLGVFQKVFGAGVAAIDTATRAKVIKGWDSFSHLNLVMAIEMKFGVIFTPDELQDMKNVGDIAALVAKKTSAVA